MTCHGNTHNGKFYFVLLKRPDELTALSPSRSSSGAEAARTSEAVPARLSIISKGTKACVKVIKNFGTSDK